MKRRKLMSSGINDLIERSLIVCLALIAIVALNFLYARRAFAAEAQPSASSLRVAQVETAPNPELTPPTNVEDETESTGIDDTIIPPVDATDLHEVTQVLPVTETSVMAKLHDVNLNEILMSSIAKENGASDLVKRYAHRVEADHRYVDQRLLNLAESMEMDLTAAPVLETPAKKHTHAAEVATLQSVSGDSFDGAFLEMMERGHQDAIAALADARNQLPVDSKVRLFAGQIIPILQQHLDVVRGLQDRKL